MAVLPPRSVSTREKQRGVRKLTGACKRREVAGSTVGGGVPVTGITCSDGCWTGPGGLGVGCCRWREVLAVLGLQSYHQKVTDWDEVLVSWTVDPGDG